MTDQPDYDHARNYWKVLKHRLIKEGNETVTNCNQLKMLANDGKIRLTDVADQQQLFRIIQSIPSPKAMDGASGKRPPRPDARSRTFHRSSHCCLQASWLRRQMDYPACQEPKYFSYEGKMLSELRKEKEK